jgi:hypothetical protein
LINRITIVIIATIINISNPVSKSDHTIRDGREEGLSIRLEKSKITLTTINNPSKENPGLKAKISFFSTNNLKKFFNLH